MLSGEGRFRQILGAGQKRSRDEAAAGYRRFRRYLVPLTLILGLIVAVTPLAVSTVADALPSETTIQATPTHYVVQSGVARPKYLVLMVLDGGRPDYFNTASLPHYQALRRNGTQFTNAVSGLLEAETPAGHAAISTGSRPDRNGILGFDWADDNDRYSLFNPDKMGDLVQILRDSHAPTIAGLYKKHFPGSKVVALSGHKYYAAAPLGGPDADAIMYYQGNSKGQYVPVSVPGHTPPANIMTSASVKAPTTHNPTGTENKLATKLAISTVNSMKPRVLLINYPEFDWPLGHVDGGITDRAKVKQMMKDWDADLGMIESAYSKKGILGQTMFVITSDHGMMPIKRFVPRSLLENAVSKAGTKAPDLAANSGVYIWLEDTGKAQTVARNIVAARNPGIQSAYYLTSSKGKAAYAAVSASPLSGKTRAHNAYLLSSLLNGHQPSVVVFGTEGTSFSDPKSGWKGDHGGGSWESQHLPLVISGPGIRKGVKSNVPAQLEDIAPTVLTDMGVEPTGMEGHVLTEALKETTSQARQTRAAETRQIGTIWSQAS